MKLKIETSVLKGFVKECADNGKTLEETLRMGKQAFAHEFFQNDDYCSGFESVLKKAGFDLESVSSEFVEDCLMATSAKHFADELA